MYIQLMHEPPAEDIEPSAEQISALGHMIKGHYAPYVDSSKRTQLNARFLRQQQFAELMFNIEGVLVK